MPGIDERLRDAIDRLGTAPDLDLIVRRVDRRRTQIRARRRVQTIALVAAVLIGVIGGVYALLRTFGVGITNPVPATSPPTFTASAIPTGTTPSPTASLSSSPSASASASAEVCSPPSVLITAGTPSGAAGTINTVWRVTNHGTAPCTAVGYPAMAMHGSGGWLNVRVQHGGHPNIDQRPATVVVQPGGSAYFGSYWTDVTTQQGPCTQFDRVRVTLPGATAPIEVATSGCVNPGSVMVGPVANSPPT